MAQLLLTKLTNPDVEVYINPLKIISMKRKLKPNTSLELLQTLYPTQIMLDGGNSVLVDESPEEIIEAIKATNSMNWGD